MERTLLRPLLQGLIGAAALFAFAPDARGQAIENTGELCIEQAAAQEREKAIPEHLLKSIALTETGRWDGSRQENSAWPWTITADGQGRFFDTKEEAVLEAEILITEGVRNIDVGCMQVNLHYHPSAFETLAQAFDPAANTAYAAKYLKALRQATGNWIEAAGRYHSATPGPNRTYKRKVLAQWNRARGFIAVAEFKTDEAPAAIDAQAPAIEAAKVDPLWTERLNSARRDRLELDRQAEARVADGTAFAMRRHEELDSWRRAQTRGMEMAHLMAMRRAEQDLRRRKRLANLGKRDFADSRRQQLQEWRERGIWSGG